MDLAALKETCVRHRLVCGQSIIVIFTKSGEQIPAVLVGISLDSETFEKAKEGPHLEDPGTNGATVIIRAQDPIPNTEDSTLLFVNLTAPTTQTYGIPLREVQTVKPAHEIMMQ